MEHTASQTAHELAQELLLARHGFGPLLQRDYWAVIDRCRFSPSQLMAQVLAHFEAFAPPELVGFQRQRPEGQALEIGDELHVHIAGGVQARVRVLHKDAQSVTLGTIRGHPEAGRITFGGYRNRRGDVIFHIRSRARAGSRLKYFGYRGAGEPMQTRTWSDFVNRVAVLGGEGVIGWIHVETSRIEDEPEQEAHLRPTFLAQGD